MQKITTAKADIMLLDKNIVKMIIHNGVYLEKEDILEIYKIKCRLIKENYHVVLHICGTDTNMCREAQEVMANGDLARNELAKAIVTNSLAQKIAGIFFTKLDKSPKPIRLFESEDEALKWLKEFAI